MKYNLYIGIQNGISIVYKSKEKVGKHKEIIIGVYDNFVDYRDASYLSIITAQYLISEE